MKYLFLLIPTLLFAQEPRQHIDYSALADLFAQWQASDMRFDGELAIPNTVDVPTSMAWIPKGGTKLVVLDTLNIEQNQFNWRAIVVVENDTTILEPDTLRFRRIIKDAPAQRFTIIKETQAMYRLLNDRGQLQRIFNTTDPETILVEEKFRKDKAAIEEKLREREKDKREKDKIKKQVNGRQ